MRIPPRPAAALATAALLLLVPSTASGQATEVKENISFVKNVAYPDLREKGEKNQGTDLEFAEIAGRQYAFAGSYGDGLQAIDITDPEKAALAGTLDCGISQGDVQVFQREDLDGRWFATYTYDDGYDFAAESACVKQVEARGFKPREVGSDGTYVVDITNPKAMQAVAFIPISDKDVLGSVAFDLARKASHNGTMHPSGKYFYNSNADLMSSVANRMPEIEVFDLTDVTAPKRVASVPLKVIPGVGTESHDITFNADGTRAYSAALSQGVIIDSTKPGEAKIVTSFLDPSINVWHQSDPVRIGGKSFLVVEDEFAGAVGTGQCPNGGVHVYDITGAKELNPVKVGFWNIDTIDATFSPTDSCTAHVFDIHEKEQIMTIAYYNGGVRVVDLGGLTGVGIGGTTVPDGLKQIGYYRTQNANAWSAKTPKIQGNGDFYLYGNDIRRGLDIFKFDADKPKAAKKGNWATGAEAHRPSAADRLSAMLDADPLLSYGARAFSVAAAQ